MVRRIAVLTASLAAVAIVAVGVGPAAAADTPPTLRDAVAARLGISGEQLQAAFKAELTARIDAAVAAGKLTADQGAKLKERIANAKGLGIIARRGFAKRHKAFVHRIARAKLKHPAAEYLGMSREELAAARKSGTSLAQLAESKGKSVDGLVAAIVAPAKTRLAKAVANGRLTQQRSDEILARLTDRVEKLVGR